VTSHKISPAIRIVMLAVLLVPPAVWSQMPSLAKLVVKSTPNRAQITVDDRPTAQVTDAIFVVAPGDHKVSVSGSANCSDYTVRLNAGETKTLVCSGGNWTVQ
jgi:hypothetical protein